MTRPPETGWLDDTPIGDNLVRRFLHNQGDLGVLLATSAGGEADKRPDVIMGWYDTDIAYNNQAVLLQPLSARTLDDVERFYAARTGPATLLSAWPTQDLSGRGWSLLGHPMLVVRGPGHLEVPVAPGLEIDVACDLAELAAAERLVIEGYPLPGARPGTAFSEGLLCSPYLVRIGCVDGEPVSVAASHVAHDVQNLCLAATLPAGRRRGVWSALVAARVNDEPSLPSMAFTSDDSRPGFVKLGYLPVMRMTMWLRP